MTEAQVNLKKWREDPACFVREVFGVEPDPWQLEALEAFAVKNRISMQACKGPGKTALLSWCAWNFLLTRPQPKMAATSISGDNLSDNLWPEMSKWQQKSQMLLDMFTWTKTRIFAKAHPETWFFSARNWSQSADKMKQSETLAGLHADFLFFVIDEAGGIPDSVMAAAEAGLSTGIETKIMMAGNPSNLEGPLYRAAVTERHLWHVIEITGDPDDPKRSSRVSAQWAREQIQRYGRDNPWVLTNVFGKFPPSSLNTLIGPTEVQAAMNRFRREDEFAYSQKRLGIDVARFGSDSSVIFPRQGLVAFRPIEMRNARTNEIASRAVAAKYKWKSELEFVDGTGGFGAGVIDSMLQAGVSSNEVHFSGKADDARYMNKRAEMWFRMTDWIKKGGALPNIPEMVREFTEPTYMFHNGKFKIEEKEQIKDRLGFSPDRADALALTFAIADQPAGTPYTAMMTQGDVGKLKSEWDPFV